MQYSFYPSYTVISKGKNYTNLMSCTQVYDEPALIDNENTNGKYPL